MEAHSFLPLDLTNGEQRASVAVEPVSSQSVNRYDFYAAIGQFLAQSVDGHGHDFGMRPQLAGHDGV